MFYRGMPTTLIPDDDAIENLDAIEDALFVGYPLDIYDRVNNLPIAREGMAATPLSVDYRCRPQFLVDASVVRGSSGSPVFVYYAGPWNDRYGELLARRRALLPGIIGEPL